MRFSRTTFPLSSLIFFSNLKRKIILSTFRIILIETSEEWSTWQTCSQVQPIVSWCILSNPVVQCVARKISWRRVGSFVGGWCLNNQKCSVKARWRDKSLNDVELLMTVESLGLERTAWMSGKENFPSVKSSAKLLFCSYWNKKNFATDRMRSFLVNQAVQNPAKSQN